MPDLGSIAALIADIEAKVTTNGNGENTGARVRECLKNIAETLDAAVAAIPTAPPVLRTGSAIAFDRQAIYNSPSAPSNGTVTVDLTAATVVEVVAYFNHPAEPAWPSGVTGYGVWNPSAVNVVRFIRLDDSNISAVIVSDAAAAYTNTFVEKRLTAGNVPNTTTTNVVVTGLSHTILAGRRYSLSAYLKVSGTATGGIKVGLGGTGVTFWASVFGNTATASFTLDGSSGTTLGTVINKTYSVGAGTNSFIRLEAEITGGVSDQVIDIIMVSATSGQAATVYDVGTKAVWSLVP